MAREALYFPTIRVPHGHWFLQTLLYWDRVSAIVPYEAQTPQRLGWRMQNYVDAGLVRLVSPDTYVHLRSAFADELVEDVETSPELEALQAAFQARHVRTLHTQKADRTFFERLAELGVAGFDEGEEWASWWSVEASVATRYMAALARVIANGDDTRDWGEPKPVMDPVTDSPAHLEALLETERAFVKRAGALRTQLLDVALPRVSGPLVAPDIVAFKQQHGERLIEFRAYLEKRVNEIAAHDDPSVREAQTAALRDSLEGRLDAIAARLSATEWKVDRKGSLLRIGASVLEGAGLAAAASPGEAYKGVKQTVAGVVKAKAALGDVGPLAYAVAARKRFGSG